MVETLHVSFSFIILLNNRFDSTTGTFTVPSGGNGYYYFSAYFLVSTAQYAGFDIQINGQVLCTARGDDTDSSNEEAQAACSAAIYTTEGLYLLNSGGSKACEGYASPLGVEILSISYSFWENLARLYVAPLRHTTAETRKY